MQSDGRKCPFSELCTEKKKQKKDGIQASPRACQSVTRGLPGGGFHFHGQGFQWKRSKLIHLFPAVNRTKLTLFSENELFDVP